MLNAKSVTTPLPSGAKLFMDDGEPLDTAKYHYQALTGAFNWLAYQTRPDIAYATSVLSSFNSAPRWSHWVAAMHVLRYLAGTMELGLVYGKGDGFLVYCDADWAGDPETSRSTTGYVGLFHGAPVFWRSAKQRTVARSSTEAEYVAAGDVTAKVIHITNLLGQFGHVQLPVKIMGDNQSCLKLVANPVSTNKTKHIRIQHHFVRERVLDGEVSFHYVPTRSQLADCFTKNVPGPALAMCREGLGMG
jgi:hypothetical protein